MTRWGVIVATLCVATGCDAFFGVREFPDSTLGSGDAGSGDASIMIDAPAANPCLDRIPRPLFCADFDESPITVYNNNIANAFAPDTATAMATLRSPSMTGPTALWIDSTHDQLFRIYGPSTTMLSSLDATFWLNVTGPAGGATGLFRLTLTGGLTCYFNLQVEPGPQRLYLYGLCPTEYHSDVITPLPSGWVHIKLHLDQTPGVVSVTLNDDSTPAVTLTFNGLIGNAKPSFQIGLESGNASGFSVGYDDLAITGS